MSDELEGGCQCASRVLFALRHADLLHGRLHSGAHRHYDRKSRRARVSPALHYWDSDRLPWIEFADHLSRYAEFPPTE
jgi:hypothetical protein